jgi:regulator of replication initiation timing
MDNNRDFSMGNYEELLEENRRLAQENAELKNSLNNKKEERMEKEDYTYFTN